MTGRISQQQLESYLWGAATLLRGTIDAGDYKQFIFPLLFCKRLCDVFDEETQSAIKEFRGDADAASYPENHRFQIPAEAHWRCVRQVSKDVGRAIQAALRAIETANPDKLYGIFGDAQWTNKERLPDAMLRDLIEHFSSLELSVANLPEDELGNGYEYLIKKFADDSGHTAAEFYTNRTVVHLMTEMLDVQPGEWVYDPTCGSGGMLLSCIAHLRSQGKEWRNVKLYGQERNLMTSSIARMNCFLHGIEDFRIERGDTLAEPKFVERDHLMHFDVVLANPPYSIKQWDRETFASDPWGRNLYGTPPQSRADYAFWQHILASLAPRTGRCAILFPHGVLFRDAEEGMRRKIIEADLIEAIIGLGPNLFYNSTMPSCIVICRSAKTKARKGKILLINAANEVTREQSQSFLTDHQIRLMVVAYRRFRDEHGFARVVSLEDVRARHGDLNLPLYVPPATINPATYSPEECSIAPAIGRWLESRTAADQAMRDLLGKYNLPERDSVLRPTDVLPILADKSRWQRVRLGDVVTKTEEVEREPLDAGLNRYLLVEHLDADSLRIRRWGNIADGSLPPTFYKVFHKGQVLYPTRNPHLRRAAVAHFDGICGEKTLTLSAREAINAKFLPLIFQTEAFIAFATNRRIGSTNPHIRWRDVAEFEFALPPLDQQRRMAELIRGMDGAMDMHLEAEGVCLATIEACRHRHFAAAKRQYKMISLRDVGHWSSGSTPSRNKSIFWNGSFPWVSAKDMKGPSVQDSEEHLSEAGRREAVEIGPGCLLLVVRGLILAHTFPVGITRRAVAFNQDMKGLCPSESYSVDYLFSWFKWATPSILARVSDSSHGTKRLAMDDLFEMAVPMPPVAEQLEVVDQVTTLEDARDAIRLSRERIGHMRSALINILFRT